MCGIIGVFNVLEAEQRVATALQSITYRGVDGSKIVSLSNGAVGHALHAVVHHVQQPLQHAGLTFLSNCEIYNWKELCTTYDLSAKNDAETLFQLLHIKSVEEVLSLLDGVYSFCFIKEGKMYLARDIFGVKPLWYSHANGFYFASEKKALEAIGCTDVQELNPRSFIVYDVQRSSLEFLQLPFVDRFPTNPEWQEEERTIVDSVADLLKTSVQKRLPGKKLGVLFSGGVDSTVLALLCKQLGVDVTCYVTAVAVEGWKTSADLVYAKEAAQAHGFTLRVVQPSLKDIQETLSVIVPLIEDSNVVKVGVALTMYFASKAAKDDGCKVLFSGLGSEELFAGYQRHRVSERALLNRECFAGLRKLYERDLYRDDVVTMHNSIELRLPFLDYDLVSYALCIPPHLKIHKGIEKYVLRQVALQLGVSSTIAFRKKKAAQYGSLIDKALGKLAKQRKYNGKSSYLLSFYPSRNVTLGVLISTGKDSLYAAYVMHKQNYPLRCFITLKSENVNSYMFHTPNIHLASLQAEASELPLITVSTAGEKEKELAELEFALRNAKEKYGVQGIVTGAIASKYQRDRIEKVCDNLGLKIFSPLWHLNPETYMRELLQHRFSVVISSIAADGLSLDMLGQSITSTMINFLVDLNKKNGINIAFEGGEAETLVLNCPLFKKKIEIVSAVIEQESEHVGRYIVQNAKLVEK